MAVRNKKLIVVILIITALIGAIVFFTLRNRASESQLNDCTTSDCVIYVEDPGNTCFWDNGKVSGGTLVYTPRESMKRVSVSKDQLDYYLKDAESKGKCTNPE